MVVAIIILTACIAILEAFQRPARQAAAQARATQQK